MKPEKQKEHKWLPKKDAMRYLSVSQRCIENWVNRGILKKYVIGGRVLFDQYEIDEFIRNSGNRMK